jgi:hypothetical protein
MPLSTLHVRPYGRPPMTRGRCDWLGLHRTTLAFATPHRFIPALPCDYPCPPTIGHSNHSRTMPSQCLSIDNSNDCAEPGVELAALGHLESGNVRSPRGGWPARSHCGSAYRASCDAPPVPGLSHTPSIAPRAWLGSGTVPSVRFGHVPGEFRPPRPWALAHCAPNGTPPPSSAARSHDRWSRQRLRREDA